MDELIGEVWLNEIWRAGRLLVQTAFKRISGRASQDREPTQRYPSSVVGPEITKLPGPGLTGSAGTSKTKRRGREWNDVKVVSRRAS